MKLIEICNYNDLVSMVKINHSKQIIFFNKFKTSKVNISNILNNCSPLIAVKTIILQNLTSDSSKKLSEIAKSYSGYDPIVVGEDL